VTASPAAPDGVVREGRIGLRAPNHPVPLALVAASGPLAATSANLSGAVTPTDIAALEDLFGTAVACYVDGGPIETTASTVVDASGDGIVVVREGVISAEALERAIGS